MSTVAILQASHAALECFFFKLDGVTSINPQSPGNWFAVSRNDPDQERIYALLLTAKATGAQVQVQTSGAMSCGYADATYVFLM